MPTYIYAERNGNASLVLSADNEEEANKYLRVTVTFPEEWRLDQIEEEPEHVS